MSLSELASSQAPISWDRQASPTLLCDQTEPGSVSAPLIPASLLSASGWEESQKQNVLFFSA